MHSMPSAFVVSVSLLATVWAIPSPQVPRTVMDASGVCNEISRTISNASDVYYPGHELYEKDIFHWALSSTERSVCAVEPGTPEDISKILKIVAKNRTPFAVKGGGHSPNVGFSSTHGIQIAMFRFSEVTYHPESNTATIGSGLIWDDVYRALEPHKVTVVGGRVSGVGVAGFTLGGGYSYMTNQYGLSSDNVVQYELVMPCGKIVNVTEQSEPDLFFGLRGGLNNFGIVTRFTMKAFHQPEVWGGLIVYEQKYFDAVEAANYKFEEVTDPKASLMYTFTSSPLLKFRPAVVSIVFYDGPTPPPGMFDEILAIPSLFANVSTYTPLDHILTQVGANETQGSRVAFGSLSFLGHTPALIAAIVNETEFWLEYLAPFNRTFIGYTIEPFLQGIFERNPTPAAYPPDRSRTLLPLNIMFAWKPESSDDIMHWAVRESTRHLRSVAEAEGQDLSGKALYPNYAPGGTPIEAMYGQNVAKLKAIKASVDPENVMGLAGGPKF